MDLLVRAPDGTTRPATDADAERFLTLRGYTVRKVDLPVVQRRIYALIQKAGPAGLTDDEVGFELGIAAKTIAARRCELSAYGLVVDSAKRRTGLTGRQRVVWVDAKWAPEAARDPGPSLPAPPPLP